MAPRKGAGDASTHRDGNVDVLLALPQKHLAADILKSKAPRKRKEPSFVRDATRSLTNGFSKRRNDHPPSL